MKFWWYRSGYLFYKQIYNAYLILNTNFLSIQGSDLETPALLNEFQN